VIFRFSSVAALSAVASVVGVAPAASAGTGAARTSLEIVVSSDAVRGTHSLQAGKTNVVVASTRLAFKVAIHNPTAHRRQHMTVTLFVKQRPMTNIWKRLTLDKFAPHQRRTVTFAKLGIVAFAREENLKVTVRTGSETYVLTYPVIFALG
jgi:hypothetical protein